MQDNFNALTKIKILLVANKMTQADLAKELGCSRPHFSKGINGGIMGRKLVARLSEWSGLSTDEILSLREDSK